MRLVPDDIPQLLTQFLCVLFQATSLNCSHSFCASYFRQHPSTAHTVSVHLVLGDIPQLLTQFLCVLFQATSLNCSHSFCASCSRRHPSTAHTVSVRLVSGDVPQLLTQFLCVLFQATSLNCSHSFCASCIEQWMKVKKQCPVCRTPVTSHLRSLVLDSYIDRMVEHLSDDMRRSRDQLIAERKGIGLDHFVRAKYCVLSVLFSVYFTAF